MARGMHSVARSLPGVLALATLATAQQLTVTNYTNATMSLRNFDTITLILDAQTIDGLQEWETSLLPATNVPLNNSVQGGTLLVDYANTQNASSNIAYISCDPASGYTSQEQVLSQSITAKPAGVILYTTTGDYCNLTEYNSTFPYIFSLMNASDATQLIKIITSYGGTEPSEIWSYVAPTNVSDVKPDIMNNTSGSGSGSGGGTPGPTTAIAMIILYTITGVITVLFLTIIVTGAVRAHRHPERYGLRAGVGRPRRSRAHGIARAMLDSLPIVKFGDHEADQAAKPAEVELGPTTSNTSNGSTEMTRNPEGTTEHTTTASAPADASLATHAAQTSTDQHPRPSGEQSSSSAQQQESGITAAATPAPVADDAQGCSICTEDFELGQDIRVLPCDHRFHPACIDPWLLNVSGTCPLCRIDLHPRRGSDDSVSDDEDGHDGTSHGNTLAPPLALQQGDAAATRRLSIRRSIMIGLMGIGGGARPETMSREERVRALRQLRGQQAARRRREELEAVAATPEEESRLRTRLRGVFQRSVRRSRIEGTMATVNEGTSSSAIGAAATAPAAPSAPSTDVAGSRAVAPDGSASAGQGTRTDGAGPR